MNVAILLPLLFVQPSKLLDEIIQQSRMKYHQMLMTVYYVFLPTHQANDIVKDISQFLEPMGAWMSNNQLKLNRTRTSDYGFWTPLYWELQLFPCGFCRQLHSLIQSLWGIFLGLKALAQRIDKRLPREAFAQLNLVCHLHLYLDWEFLITVTHSLVISCLDCCDIL